MPQYCKKQHSQKRNAARSSVSDNVSELEHGEDVSQEKLSHTGEDFKAQYNPYRLCYRDNLCFSSVFWLPQGTYSMTGK